MSIDFHPDADFRSVVDRRTRQLRQRRRLLGAAAGTAVVAIGVLLPLALIAKGNTTVKVGSESPTLCAPSSSVQPATPVSSLPVAAPAPGSTAEVQACQMLEAIVLPVGARQVQSLGGGVFSQPSSVPACDGLTVKTVYLEVPDDPLTVATYVGTHAPSWLPYGGPPTQESDNNVLYFAFAGSPTGVGWSRTPNPDAIAITIAAYGSGISGIRVDAQVVPPSASCVGTGAG
jgi:hypothetical protein